MQVAQDLRRRVASGEFEPGSKLPALRTLAVAYEVAEVTAHTAIRELQREGLLESTAGRGTFVTADPSAIARAKETRGDMEALRAEVADLRARVDRIERERRSPVT